MSNSVIVKTEENDHYQHNSAAATTAARQLTESADAPVNNETQPKLLPPPPASSIAGEPPPPRVVAVAPAAISQPAQNAKKLRFVQTAAMAQQLVQTAKKLPVVVPRFSPAVSSQLSPHQQQQQRPPRLLGNFHRILRTPTRVFRVVTPSGGCGGGGGGSNQQCKQNIGTGNCQPAPPAAATNVSATAPVAATATETATNATTAAAATATASTTTSTKTIWKMRVNGKQHWPKVSPSQRAPHIAMSSPRHPSYIIRAQASDGQQKPKQQQQQTEQPNNLLGMDNEGNEMKKQKQKEVLLNVGGQWRTYRGDEFQAFVPVKAPSSATTVTTSPAAAVVTVVAPYTVMATSPPGSSATVSLASAQAACTSAAATTSGEIAAGDALVAVMDSTGLRRSQRKAGGSNGGAAGLLTMAGTSTKDELRRNDSGGAVSDVLAAVRPKRMSILNKQLNYADGDESEGSGIVSTARPSQIGVGQQFQAELPEDGDQQQQKHQQQQQRPQAVQTTANASSSSREDLVDRDECLWSSTEFANTKLVELKDLEVFCDVVRRHSKLDIEKALNLLNSSSFSQPFALCNLEKFACSNGKKATKWPESMDEQLIDLLNKHGKNFGKIAKNLSGEWNGPQAELVQRYYTLKSERCFSSNSAQFVRCPHIKILGPPVEQSDRRPVARTKCANCTQKLWRDPKTVGAEWRGRRRPPVLCPPCELYARKQKMHRPAQLLLEDDSNYDVKAQKPAPPDARHDDGNAVNGGGGGTVAEDAPRQQQRRQRHDDCKCMLARAVATRVQQQQLAQLQRRRSLDIIKQELPPTPEGSTNGVAEAEVQNDDDNNNDSGWPDEMKQRCAKAFLTEGKNFEAIAASLGGTKSADDIADFYSEHQFTLRLDYIISLHTRAKNDERNVPTLRATARNGQQKQQQKAKALAGKKRKKNKKVAPVKKVIAKREIAGKRGECVRQAETGRNSVEREETVQKQQQQANGAGGGEEMTAFDEFLAAFDRNRKRNDNDGTH